MVEGDIFREVDEEMRRERAGEMWNKYGSWVIGAAVAFVALVAGYKYWTWSAQQQAANTGAQYVKALNDAGTPEKDKRDVKGLSNIAAGGPAGYAMLSKLRLAATKAASGKTDEAVKDYDGLAKGGASDPLFKDFSRIQAAMLRIDKADEAEMKQRLQGLATKKGAWRHSARELLGLAAFKAQNHEAAKKHYNDLLGDRDAPSGLRQRAEMMLSLILEQTADKEKQGAATK